MSKELGPIEGTLIHLDSYEHREQLISTAYGIVDWLYNDPYTNGAFDVAKKLEQQLSAEGFVYGTD